MLRVSIFTIVCLLGVFASTPVRAGLLGSYLTFDGPVHNTLNVSGNPFQGGGEDLINDDSVSAFVDTGAAGFSTGDIVWGILSISDVKASGRASVNLPPNQIAVVFSAIVGAPFAGGGFSLGAIGSAGNAYDLRNLLAGSNAAAVGGLTDSSVFAVLSTTNSSSTNDPLNWKAADVATNFANAANGWKWDLTAGFGKAADFFEFAPSAGFVGIDKGALTITSHSLGSSVVWLPVDVKDLSAGAIHKSDITLNPGFIRDASSAKMDLGWDFEDQSSLFVNAVPEPGSFAVVGLLGLGAFLRRRKV